MLAVVGLAGAAVTLGLAVWILLNREPSAHARNRLPTCCSRPGSGPEMSATSLGEAERAVLTALDMEPENPSLLELYARMLAAGGQQARKPGV